MLKEIGLSSKDDYLMAFSTNSSLKNSDYPSDK